MTDIGPPVARRTAHGSVDTEYYVTRAKRCRNRALGDLFLHLLSLICLRPPAAIATIAPAARPLAGVAARSSKTSPPPLECDDGRQHDGRADAPDYVE